MTDQPTTLPTSRHADDDRDRRRSRRRWTSIALAVAIVFVIAGIAAAALMIQARFTTDATPDDRTLEFAVGSLPTTADPNGTIVTDTAGTDGTCLGSLSGGFLSVDWANFWDGSTCDVANVIPGGSSLWIIGDATELVAINYPADFGAPGSGEPIEVDVIDQATGLPIVLPYTLNGDSAVRVWLAYTVNAAAADPGVTYSGEVTIDGA